jgi:hypothetical protein
MKKNIQFTNIYQIFKSLKAHELSGFKVKLKSDNYFSNNETQIYQNLYSCLILNTENQFTSLKENLGDKLFQLYLERFESMLLDSMVLNENILKSHSDNRTITRIKLSKLYIEGLILHGRGVRNQSERLYKKALFLGEKYEMFPELIQISKSLISILKILNRGKEAELYRKKHDNWVLSDIAVLKAEKAYQDMLSFEKQGISAWDQAPKLIESLHYRYKKTKASLVLHHMTVLQANFYMAHNDLEKAAFYLRKQIRVLKKHPSIYYENREGGALLNLSENFSKTQDFKQSSTYAAKARLLFTNPEHKALCLQFEFYAQLRLGRYRKSIGIGKILLDPDYDHISWRLEFRKLSLSWLYLLQGDVKKAGLYEPVNHTVFNGFPAWKSSYRIYLIMKLILQEKTELAITEIDNFRKYKYSIKNINHLDLERINLAYDFLQAWSKNDFDQDLTDPLKAILGKYKRLKSDFTDWDIIPLPIWFDKLS